VRRVFRLVEDNMHYSGLARLFCRESTETAKPWELRRDQVRLGQLQAAILKKSVRRDEAQRSLLEVEEALKTAAPEVQKAVRDAITRFRNHAFQLTTEIKTLEDEKNVLEKKTADQTAYIYVSELLDYIRSGRYAVSPRAIANALAGLPTMGWRQSHLRCSRMPYGEPRLQYQVLQAIVKIWKRRQGESVEYLVAFFKEQLTRLPKKLGYTRDFLLENWHDMKLAIEECAKKYGADGETPYALAFTFMKIATKQKTTLERLLAQQEKLNVQHAAKDFRL
jgi:hypothetical protein